MLIFPRDIIHVLQKSTLILKRHLSNQSLTRNTPPGLRRPVWNSFRFTAFFTPLMATALSLPDRPSFLTSGSTYHLTLDGALRPHRSTTTTYPNSIPFSQLPIREVQDDLVKSRESIGRAGEYTPIQCTLRVTVVEEVLVPVAPDPLTVWWKLPARSLPHVRFSIVAKP